MFFLNHGDPQKCEQFANDIRRKVRLDARVPSNLRNYKVHVNMKSVEDKIIEVLNELEKWESEEKK